MGPEVQGLNDADEVAGKLSSKLLEPHQVRHRFELGMRRADAADKMLVVLH